MTMSAAAAPHSDLSPVVWASADKSRVVAPDQRSMERRADTRVSLCADDEKDADP